MRIFLLIVFIGSFFGIDIGKINALKKEAEKAFAAGDYQKAADTYQYLADSMGVREDEVLLNLASAKYQLADTAGAGAVYRQLTAASNRKIRSKAHQQLGVMASKKGKLEEAVADFKHALQADPSNQDARYNYELAARKLAEQKKKEQQQQQNKDNKDQQDKDKKDQQQKQKDQQNQDKKNQEQKQKDQQEKQKQEQEQQKKEQEKKEQEKREQEKKENEQEQKPKQFDPERMKQMKVSEDKARMILDAMKNNEIQYFQQNKRKATKPKDKNRPDW